MKTHSINQSRVTHGFAIKSNNFTLDTIDDKKKCTQQFTRGQNLHVETGKLKKR
jgi:hypothetical protein